MLLIERGRQDRAFAGEGPLVLGSGQGAAGSEFSFTLGNEMGPISSTSFSLSHILKDEYEFGGSALSLRRTYSLHDWNERNPGLVLSTHIY